MSTITDTIKKIHSNDNAQLDIIFSSSPRIMVEAPAGCGKTKTMVSKIAYIIATEQLPKHKKILALTFSVNAAYKMKKDIVEQLPSLGMDTIKSPADINRRMYVSNYHGFARKILGLYGYLLSPYLKDIYLLQAIDDNNIESLMQLNLGLSLNDATKISKFNDSVKNAEAEYIKNNLNDYLNYVYNNFLPNNYIPYNAYLLLLKELLEKKQQLKNFLIKLYPIIIIDEFQDTNILSWNIIRLIIRDDSRLIFLGDSLQRIYGFIGAIPNLISLATKQYNMKVMKLVTNYRFKNNPNMLLLDKNIRENASNWGCPHIDSQAVVPFKLFDSQEDEIAYLLDNFDPNEKTAVLVQSRTENLNMLLNELKMRKIDYFYALFKEDDNEYITYHNDMLRLFSEKHKKGKRISKTSLESTLSSLRLKYDGTDSPTISSLLALSKIFFERVLGEYGFLTNEEKYLLITDALANRSLKQNMEYVDAKLVISTIHGAKGLEWEYVFLPDMEQYVFPNFYSLCGKCNFNHNSIREYKCILNPNDIIAEDFLDLLSVFYVAVTRAKKQIYFSASKKRYGYKGETNSKISCLLSLPGIILN